MSLGFRDRFFKGQNATGLDLAALIIQMGRDHGIPSYTNNREGCRLSRPRSFEELKPLLWDSVDLNALKNVYESVDDADLFVLGLAEKADRGSLLGPTFNCIFRRQFKKVRIIFYSE
jgi:peroxidase